MLETTSPRAKVSVGALLQHWRKARHLSQLGLANTAQISPRHLCFLETGRARPSREMVLLLANALDVPLRERNALLLAAGFAPMFEETRLDAPALATVRAALDAILRHHEPFPAIVMDRHWNVVSGNEAARRFFAYMLDWSTRPANANMIRLMFDPRALRPRVQNWKAVAVALFHRIQREAVCGVRDGGTTALLEDVLAYPDVRPILRNLDLEKPSIPVIPISFMKSENDGVFNYFSTVTTLGTPQDITLQELRIECFFPTDPETEDRARVLSSDPPASDRTRRPRTRAAP
jgi:transcriptional regulator with XRE-family HTH domain